MAIKFYFLQRVKLHALRPEAVSLTPVLLAPLYLLVCRWTDVFSRFLWLRFMRML